MIGFKPCSINRVAINNCQGQRVAYLSSENGRQVIRDTEGRKLATIKKWNQYAIGRVGACSGSIIRY